MPRKSDRKGYRATTIEAPAGVLASIEAAAAAAGESVNVYFVRAAARRAMVAYEPPKRGRPKATTTQATTEPADPR